MTHSTSDLRGIQLYVSDLDNVDWSTKLKVNGLNLIGLHGSPAGLKMWQASDEGQRLLSELDAAEIHIEYGIHFTPSFMTEELFGEHPEWFCMDICGVRYWEGANPCISNEQLLNYATEQAASIVADLPASTHRYQLWAADAQPWCNCEGCQRYTPSEQNLILMNAMLDGVRFADPLGQLTYLAYMETVPAPREVTPEDGIFLTFAPYRRNMMKPLTEVESAINREHVQWLQDLLAVFHPGTVRALDYWLDVSLFSGTRANPAVEVAPNPGLMASDLMLYHELGIRDVQCFACRMDADYIKQFGEQPLIDYGNAFQALP
jgi:hypothetical protein